jgi:hypothetical protein
MVTMKKFARIKTRAEVLAQCRAQRVKVDQRHYKAGSDWTTLSRGGCTVIWCSFNGNFFGTTPDGTRFSSREITHENEPWFQALLSFFYVEKA